MRYGGVRGVAIAERLFAASSETAMAVFDRIGLMSRERRLGVALPCAISTLAAFHDDSASAGKACRLYAAGNISLAGSSSSAAEAMRQLTRMAERNARRVGVRLREIWNAARDSQPIEPALDRYGEEARSARARLDEAENKGEIAPRIATNGPYLRMSFAQWVLPSYLHMMNNRLGLSRVAEAEVALLLSEALKWSDNGAEAHATNNA